MNPPIPYNIQIVNWAIARAGFSVQQFAEQNPEIKILDWIENRKQPTITQLEKFSNKVHLPFGYLFLTEPPKESLPFPFFRTGKINTTQVSTEVYDTIQIIQRRQDWLKDYLIETEGSQPLTFVSQFSIESGANNIAKSIKRSLQLKDDWAVQFSTVIDARNALIEKIENLGIIVTVAGYVGNNTKRTIPVDECRGFVLVDEYVPFLFVNNKDAQTAQIFTLIHELVHVWLGKSAGFDLNGLLPANDPIEKLCDEIAASILVPQNLFDNKWELTNNFHSLSMYFKVSPIVIARRALDLKKINKDVFFSFYNSYKIKGNDNDNDIVSGGGNFYHTAKWRLSPRFMGYINQAVENGDLLYTEAYRLTGLTGKTYPEFLKQKM